MPLRTAQARASRRTTSGSAGFSGGFLPVAAFQDVLSPLRATLAAPSVLIREKMVQILELSLAMPGQYRGG